MEQFLGTVIDYDTIILTLLIASIAIILLLLLILNFSSPESVVLNEYGSSDEFEGTLRRVLGEGGWAGGGSRKNALEDYQAEQFSGQLDKLESEVLAKDKKIADLHKQLTQSGGATVSGVIDADSQDLLDKIKDLEARLQEYEIIEDDIADLSKYKTENNSLQDEIDRLKAKLASMDSSGGEAAPESVEAAAPTPEPVEPVAETAPEPVAEAVPEPVVEEAKAEEIEENSADVEETSGKDLVAEFEKVVNDQENGGSSDPVDEPAVEIKMQEDETSKMTAVSSEVKDEYGDVMMAKLQEMEIEPDSKEEAELLIGDLKLIKKDSKDGDS